MSLSVVWLEAAVEEFKDAVSRYTEIHHDLGLRFVSAVDDTVEAIRSGPLHFAELVRVADARVLAAFLTDCSIWLTEIGLW